MEKIKGNEGNHVQLPSPGGAEARAARRFMELEAGRVLVEQAARRVEEEREKLEEERQETAERENERISRDTPELSKQSRWFGVEGRLLEEEQLKWILEMEQELWEAFKNWQPASYGSLAGQLEELSKLYLKLLEAVLTCTTGENQLIQKDRLDAVLSMKLQLLVELRLGNLVSLLEQTGEKETLNRVWYSLYKQTAGEHISMKRAGQLSAGLAQKASAGSSGVSGRAGGAVIEGRGQAEGSRMQASSIAEGSVYKFSGGNGIRMSTAFDLHRKAEAAFSVNGSAGSGNRQGVFMGEELERAEVFAAHLRESSRLFTRAGGSWEAAGYYAALTSIKGQIYVSDGPGTGSVPFPMESLVSRLVDYYLSRKEAYRAYYYTMDVYEKTKDSKMAAEKGLEYAYRMFREKGSGENSAQSKYQGEPAGFFQILSGETEEEAYRRGLQFLEKNWLDFLNALGHEGKGFTLRMHRYSPWGAVMEAEERRKGREERENRILMRQIWVAAGLVLLYLGWRFFFS